MPKYAADMHRTSKVRVYESKLQYRYKSPRPYCKKKKKMKSNINKKLQWCPMHRTMGGMVHLTVDGMTGEVSLLARVSSKYSRDFEYKSNIRHEPVFHKHTH